MVSREALKLNEILRNAPKAVDLDLTHQSEAPDLLRRDARGQRGGRNDRNVDSLPHGLSTWPCTYS